MKAGLHSACYKDGRYAVNSAGLPVDGPFSSPPRFDTIFVMHYTLSREDFATRVARGRVDPSNRTMGIFDEIEKDATDMCTQLADKV